MSRQFTTITDAAKLEISMDEFQSLVWQLSNRLFVRHYRWLNYPHKPQLFALQFADDIANTSLEAELKSLGFAWDLFNAFGRFSEKKVQIQIGQPNTVTSVAVSKLRDIFWLSGVSHCTVLVLPAVKARCERGPQPHSPARRAAASAGLDCGDRARCLRCPKVPRWKRIIDGGCHAETLRSLEGVLRRAHAL